VVEIKSDIVKRSPANLFIAFKEDSNNGVFITLELNVEEKLEIETRLKLAVSNKGLLLNLALRKSHLMGSYGI
jgi:hypothetical protein